MGRRKAQSSQYTQSDTNHCIQCGDPFTSTYGRTDKKFCCPECKNKFLYRQQSAQRALRRRTEVRIARNYELLRALIESGVKELALPEAKLMGIDPNYMTMCAPARTKLVCSCYDISYEIRAGKICKLSKMAPIDETSLL